MTQIADVGIVCASCDWLNDGAVEDCRSCQQPLLANRPATESQAGKWVLAQVTLRQRLDIETSHSSRMALRAWATEGSERGLDDPIDGTSGCVVAAWITGLPITAIGALTYWAVSDGQINDIGSLGFIFGGLVLGVPLLIYAITGTWSARQRRR